MTKIWSAAAVHPRDRLAYWVGAVCDTFVCMDCTPRCSPPDFFGEIQSEAIGELRVAKVVSAAQIITRSPRQIARERADRFLLNIQLSGCGVVSQDGRDATLTPADFALFDSTRPYQLTFDGDFAQAVLQMPRAALLPRLGASECLTATRIVGTVGIGGVLSPMLQKLPSQVDAIPAETLERLAENPLDIIATVFLSTHEKLSVSARMTLPRIKLWIEAHLGEELSGERIAGSCGLSARHLNRLFEHEGTSLMRYVWERRLAHCHRNLTDPAMRGLPVGEIAFASGFNDLSHFSRAYRTRYGCAPGDDRRRPALAP